MQINITKLTDSKLMRRACEMTMHGKESKLSLSEIYKCEHSPARTQVFWIELLRIPTFVSVHLVRHHVGVTHYVTSNRDDRGGDEDVKRDTPINHGMLINAQGLIDMSRKRLCHNSHQNTVYVMNQIKEAVKTVDPELYGFLIPECQYRGRCYELKSCGIYS